MTSLPSFGVELSIQYELIAQSGVTPVPDGVGTFTSFTGSPAIDNDGNIVLVAGGDADSNGNPQGGVYTFVNGSYQTVANFNTSVPNGGGAKFTAFYWDDTDIDDGRVAFRADTLPGFSELLGVYSNVGQSSINDLVEVAILDGTEWGTGSSPWVDGNIVAMRGQRLIPEEHTATLLWNGSNSSKSLIDPGAGYILGKNTNASISGDSAILIRVSGAGAELVISNGGAYETIVDFNNTPMPGLDGSIFSNIYNYPVVDQSSQDAAFLGFGNSKQGVFKRTNGGALVNVADTTTMIPSANGDIFKTFEQDGVSLANGQVVFFGNGQGLLNGLYTDIGGELSVIVDDNNNNTIEIDGNLEQIALMALGPKSFAYTPSGYQVVLKVWLTTGGTAIVRATINTGVTPPTPEPDISVSSSGAFGNVNVGSNSTRTVTISNTGNANLVIGSLNGLASPFTIVSNNCSGATVAPSTSCAVGVRFTPTATGTRSDTLVIPSNDPDEDPYNFNLSGTGTTAAVPDISVSGSGSFGEVEIDSNSTHTMAINNTGNAVLTINSIGGLADAFSIVSNGCGATLAAGSSCTFGVRFSPSSAQNYTDTLNISSNDPDQGIVNINVSGTGTTAPFDTLFKGGFER